MIIEPIYGGIQQKLECHRSLNPKCKRRQYEKLTVERERCVWVTSFLIQKPDSDSDSDSVKGLSSSLAPFIGYGNAEGNGLV